MSGLGPLLSLLGLVLPVFGRYGRLSFGTGLVSLLEECRWQVTPSPHVGPRLLLPQLSEVGPLASCPLHLASSSGFSLLLVTCPLGFRCGTPEGRRCGAKASPFWEALSAVETPVWVKP